MRIILVDPLLRDAFFATIMNWAIIWVCGRILHLQPRWVWMVVAAILGGIYQFSLGIRWQLRTICGWEWLLFLIVGGFIAWIAYPSSHITQSLRRIFLFYLLTFLTVGVSMGARSLLQLAGKDHLSPQCYFAINIVSLLIVAEIGWGMIHEAIWIRSHLVKLRIQLGEREITIDGLVDTGNMLRDPFTKIPVVILSFPAVRSLLPGEAARLIERLMAGEMPEPSIEDFWKTRVKILPFSSVGNSRGLLVGLTVEQLVISTPSNLKVKPAVIGFTGQTFSTGDYQAIIPAALYERALSV